jgi:hypothetical protein
MADFKYQDEAMPVQRFQYGDELPTYETSLDEPTKVNPLLAMSDEEYVDFFMTNYHDEVALAEAMAKADHFRVQHEKRAAAFDAQSTWKQIAAKNKHLAMIAAEAIRPAQPSGEAMSAMEAYTKSKYNIPDDSKEWGDTELRDATFKESGAAFVEALYNDWKIAPTPSDRIGEVDISDAMVQGIKQVELGFLQAKKGMLEYMSQPVDTSKMTMLEARRATPSAMMKYVDQETVDSIMRGYAVTEKLLEPDEDYLEKYYLMGKIEKGINDFVVMGPQIVGQVGASMAGTAIAGPVGGVAAGMMFMSPQIFGSKYDRVRELGGTPNEAFMAASLDAAGQGFLESISMAFALKGIPKKWLTNKFLRWASGAIVGASSEAVTEYVQSYVDQFSEAIGDPSFKEEFLKKSWPEKVKMIEERMLKAHEEGKYEAFIASLWGGILGAGGGNGLFDMEIHNRYNKDIDRIIKRDHGTEVSTDILKRAGRLAKQVPTTIKQTAEAQDVLNNAVRLVEETKAQVEEAQRQAAMPVDRQIEEPAGMIDAPLVDVADIRQKPGTFFGPFTGVTEEGVAPIKEAGEVESGRKLPPQIEALKETDPEAYQLYLDVAGIPSEGEVEAAGEIDREMAAKAKERPTEKAKEAPAPTAIGRPSSKDKIERLWNRLSDDQKAKVQDLYDNEIEPMSDIERYQMMQAALSGDDLKVLDRPTLEQWRRFPSLRTKDIQGSIGKKVYMPGETGRKAKQINRAIDVAYQMEYGDDAYLAEKKIAESVDIEAKPETKPVAPEKGKKAQERPLRKPQATKRADSAKALYSKFIKRVTAAGKKSAIMGINPNDISHVEKLNKVQDLVQRVAAEFGTSIAFFKSSDPILDASNGYYVEGVGMMLNANKPNEALLSLFGHEGWHEIQDNYPELADIFSTVFWKNINQSEWELYRDTLHAARAKVGLEAISDEQVRKEFESDFIATKWVDPQFLKKLLEALNKKNPGLVVRLFDILNKILANIKSFVQAEQWTYIRKDIEKVEDAVIDIYTVIQNNTELQKRREVSRAALDAIAIEMQPSIDLAKPEAIKSPASMHIPSGKIYEGPMHSFAWEDIQKEFPDANWATDVEEGYTTTHDRFVDRDEGNAIALNANQVSKDKDRPWLISEDLIKDISDTYMIKEDGQVQVHAHVAADDAALAMIDSLLKGHNDLYLGVDNHGLIAESLGYELKSLSKGKVFGQYTYKGEIYDANIIAGRFAAAWNKDLRSDERTGALLDAIAEKARLEGPEMVGLQQDRSEKKLNEYLKRSSKSYSEGESATAVKEGIPTKNVRIKGGKSTMGLIQISSLRGREETTSRGDAYFDLLYSKVDGYERPTDFWEVPTWMAHAANTFKNADAYIARNIEEAKAFLRASGYEAIMVSAMDANKHFIKELAGSFDGTIIVGGYVDPKYFNGIKNIKFAKDMKSAADLLKVPYKEGVSYRQFKGTRVIPRLEMSKGCKHKCAFCTVPKKVETADDVFDQVKSFADLGFKLVYLNDKTFGQADNYKDLVQVNKEIKKSNPEFQGFIIQTTAPAFNKLDDQFLKDSGIKYVELGMESYNDDILERVNKPHRTKHINEAVSKMRALDLKFIPNVMVGLAGIDKKGELWTEDAKSYRNTITFLEDNKDIISHTNTYILATYEGTETGDQLGTDNEVDNDENVVKKSWLTNRDLHETFYRKLLDFSSSQIDPSDIQASILMARKEDPVILPREIQEDIDTALMDPRDISEEHAFATFKMIHYLELKNQAYKKIPKGKQDSFSKHYAKQAQEELDLYLDRGLGYLRSVYMNWLSIHRGPEGWFDSQFGDELDSEYGLEPSEYFTNRQIGWVKFGYSWEWDVTEDVIEAVEEEYTYPYIPSERDELIEFFKEEFDLELSDLALQRYDDDMLYEKADQMVYDKYPVGYFAKDTVEMEPLRNLLDMDGWNSPIGKIIRKVIETKGYEAWRANFPSMDATEVRIEEQFKRMKDAKTTSEKMTALSLALNESHVYGTMSEHAGLANNELQEINNIADSIYHFEDMLRRQYKPDSAEPAIYQSLPMPPRDKDKVVDLVTKPLRDFHKSMRDRIEEGVAGQIKKIEAYKDWKFAKGDRVKSKKLGKFYTITGKFWDNRNDRPMYFYEGDQEKGSFIAELAHEHMDLVTGLEVVPQVQQSIDLKKALDGKDVKIKVAGKTYVINEQRKSIEKLLELTGGSSGLRKFLTDNGVDKTLASRIQTIGKSMEEYPFPTPQETAELLLKRYKKQPELRNWYDNIKYLRTVFENDDDVNLFMGLAMLSHTSRNKGTLANMVEFIKFRMLEKAGQVNKATKFGLVDAKTVDRVLNAKTIDEMFRIDFTTTQFKMGEVKVKAFAETFAAIMRDPNARAAVESVVDIWVSRYFFPSSTSEGDTDIRDSKNDGKALSPVQHLRVQRHMREVEAIMSKKTKSTWYPDQAQAVLWFEIRDQWEQVRGDKKIDPVLRRCQPA